MLRVIVIGAGVQGLASAWQLIERGADVTVIEARTVGHSLGSSHGPARITRRTYADAAMVRLMKRISEVDWPDLERALDRDLIVPCDGCFFGPPEGLFQRYAKAVEEAGAPVERISPAEGRRRFPAFRFGGCEGVLHDRSAGIIEASATCNGLAELVRQNGRLLDETSIEAIECGERITLRTSRGHLEADRLVVAAGAWTGRLLPELETRLRVLRQDVAYFSAEGPIGPADMPVWVRLGADENEVHYGLPEHGHLGLKAAWHRTRGAADDPELVREPDTEAIATIRHLLERELTLPVNRLLSAETCLYTCTADEHPILDRLPGDPRVVVATGFSGHGFKLAPLVGRIAANLAVDGEHGVPAFAPLADDFSIESSAR